MDTNSPMTSKRGHWQISKYTQVLVTSIWLLQCRNRRKVTDALYSWHLPTSVLVHHDITITSSQICSLWVTEFIKAQYKMFAYRDKYTVQHTHTPYMEEKEKTDGPPQGQNFLCLGRLYLACSQVFSFLPAASPHFGMWWTISHAKREQTSITEQPHESKKEEKTKFERHKIEIELLL